MSQRFAHCDYALFRIGERTADNSRDSAHSASDLPRRMS